MKRVYFLESRDIISPHDWIRPLVRSSDMSGSDSEWTTEHTYGGGPCDHLKWAPIWLRLGECWWGKTFSEYEHKTKEHFWPYEAICGEVPESHRLNLAKWERRHPLWWEGFVKRREEAMRMKFTFGGRFNGRTVKQVLQTDMWYARIYARDYSTELALALREILDVLDSGGDSFKVYYRPRFKKFKPKQFRV